MKKVIVGIIGIAAILGAVSMAQEIKLKEPRVKTKTVTTVTITRLTLNFDAAKPECARPFAIVQYYEDDGVWQRKLLTYDQIVVLAAEAQVDVAELISGMMALAAVEANKDE